MRDEDKAVLRVEALRLGRERRGRPSQTAASLPISFVAAAEVSVRGGFAVGAGEAMTGSAGAITLASGFAPGRRSAPTVPMRACWSST